MGTELATHNGSNVVAAILQNNDLSRLSAQQKNDYYMGVCNSLGMNPMTRPFDFIRLSGREVLYAKRDAADQLRKINGISIEVVSQKVENNVLTVHVRAKDKTGRVDEDFGVLDIAGLKGSDLANATMKCVTKAKRRVTLSISGLGFLDETEVSDIRDDVPNVVPETHLVSEDQAKVLETRINALGNDAMNRFLKRAKIERLADLPANQFDTAIKIVELTEKTAKAVK